MPRMTYHSTFGLSRSHSTTFPSSLVIRSIDGHQSAGTLPRAFHIAGALRLMPSASASAAALPQTEIASSRGVMSKWHVYHVRDCASNTNVMQAPGLITGVNTLASRVTAARKAADLSQQDLADRSGVGQSTIGMIENGDRKNPRNLLEIARALNVSADWLKTGRGEMTPYGGDTSSERTSSGVRISGDTSSQRAPVIEWARLGVVLLTKEREMPAEAPSLPVLDGAHPESVWAVAEADHPRFRIKRGYKLLFSPVENEADCFDSEIYLFQTLTGLLVLGEFRRMTSGYEAIPDSGAPLDSERHGIKVVAAMMAVYR